MLETPEIEAHRHKTGHSHVDLILGGLAVVLSMVSVFIAVQHGRTMERLVAANSWPNISYSTGNEEAGANTISFNLRNSGVGPARIDSFELFYKDVPMPNALALMHACCGADANNFSTSAIHNEVLPARDTIEFLSYTEANHPPAIWHVLDKERNRVHVRVCYCSVFEECWVRDSAEPRPARVAQCAPSQPVQYDQ